MNDESSRGDRKPPRRPTRKTGDSTPPFVRRERTPRPFESHSDSTPRRFTRDDSSHGPRRDDRPPRSSERDTNRTPRRYPGDDSARPPRRSFGDREGSRPPFVRRDRPAYSGDRDRTSDAPRRPYSGDDSSRPPRRSFGDREGSRPPFVRRDRPAHTGDRDRTGDAPRRPYSGDDSSRPPRRSFGDREGSRPPFVRRDRPAYSGDRDRTGDAPRRPYSGDDSARPPRRSFGDRDGSRRPFERHDRTVRSGEGDVTGDAPRRSYSGDSSSRPPRRSFGDRDGSRPPFDRRDRPARTGDRDRSSDAPRRPYSGDDSSRPPRRSFGDRDDSRRPFERHDRTVRSGEGDITGDTPRRSYSGDSSSRPPRRSSGDDSRPPFKRRERTFHPGDTERGTDRPRERTGGREDSRPPRDGRERTSRPYPADGDSRPRRYPGDEAPRPFRRSSGGRDEGRPIRRKSSEDSRPFERGSDSLPRTYNPDNAGRRPPRPEPTSSEPVVEPEVIIKKKRSFTIRPDGYSINHRVEETTVDTPYVRRIEKPKADVRSVVLRALGKVIGEKAYATMALEAELARNPLTPLDTGLATELLFGTLRYLDMLDDILMTVPKLNLNTIPAKVLDVMRLAVYQILFLDRVPSYAIVNEAVKETAALGQRKLGGMVNASLRRIDENRPAPFAPTGDQLKDLMKEAVLPEWLAARWLKHFGYEEARELGLAMLVPAQTTLRVNTLLTNTEQLSQDLTKLGYVLTNSAPGVPSLRLLKGVGISNTIPYKEGHFYLQDESSMIAPMVLNPPLGATVLDLCCGLGGKSTSLAQLMKNEGRIIGLDSNHNKLSIAHENVERLGITILETIEGGLGETMLEEADYVLLDVPCSNLGTLRHRPELKWALHPTGLFEVYRLERRLLADAARLVKPGGLLVYSTCTGETEEDEEIVNGFLAEHEQFELEDATANLPQELVESWQLTGPFVYIYPHKHNCDAAFVAALRRKA